MMSNSISIRRALKAVFRTYRIAKDTSNRQQAAIAREFIKQYWPHRNNPTVTILLPNV